MVVAHAQFFTSAARYADIILPLTTEWERFDGLFGGTLGHKSNREMMVAYQQIIDPLYEAKSDQDIACELAEKLGIARADVYPFDVNSSISISWLPWRCATRTAKPMCRPWASPRKDIDELGVEGEAPGGQAGLSGAQAARRVSGQAHSRRQLRLYCFQGLRGRPRG